MKEKMLSIAKQLIQIESVNTTLGEKEHFPHLYYAAPYCPHNTLQGENAWMIEAIKKTAESISEKTGESFRMMRFFPSLSDSSYLKIDDTKESIQNLIENFPAFQALYPVPVEKIQALNIPTVNYGCYGKDAHKWTERVHIPYTFEVLPELLLETIHRFLEGEV